MVYVYLMFVIPSTVALWLVFVLTNTRRALLKALFIGSIWPFVAMLLLWFVYSEQTHLTAVQATALSLVVATIACVIRLVQNRRAQLEYLGPEEDTVRRLS